MRISTILAAAAAAAPALVSAASSTTGGTMGFALGNVLADGTTCKSTQDYEDDFDAISGATEAKIVRGYAASQCDFAKNILPAAKAKGFQVVLGIWPDTDDSFKADTAAVVAVAKQYESTIYAVTVGSETLYRGNFTGSELNDKIKTVKGQIPSSIKIGTADSWNKFADGTADPILDTVSIVLINAFAYWQAASISNATHVYLDDMFQAAAHIETTVGSLDKMPEIWNGETGWVTANGINYGAAKGGLSEAASFWTNGYCALLAWGFNAFYFEAFDEPWKPKSTGDNGEAEDETAWGAFTVDRKAKFSLKC